jgi:hypothetical protein
MTNYSNNRFSGNGNIAETSILSDMLLQERERERERERETKLK